MGRLARAPTSGERALLEAALTELLDGRSVTFSTPETHGDAEVEQLVAFLRDEPIFAAADCGARLCACFGHGAPDPYQATAARLLAATRGNLATSKRYATWLALTRALKGLDLVGASFERGACAAIAPNAGFLFQAPTLRYFTGGKVPCAVFAPLGFDPVVALKASPQHMYACMHRQAEEMLRAEARFGGTGHALVFDLYHFGWKHLGRRFLTQVVMLIAMLLKNYPEMVGKLYIVNAPAIFSIAWAAILPFANEAVQSKISISRGPNLEELREAVGAAGLPTDLGGDVEAAAGDAPAHPAEGGRPDAAEEGGAWTELLVEAGKTAQHVVTVDEADAAAALEAVAADGAPSTPAVAATSLALEFEIEGADIAFFCVREPPPAPGGKKGGAVVEQEYAVEPTTLAAGDSPVSRLIEAAGPGVYTFVWDNTAAWRYPRTIRFRVQKLQGPAAAQGGGEAARAIVGPGTPPPEWDGLGDAEMTKLAPQ